MERGEQMAKVIYKDNTGKYLKNVQANMKMAAQDIKNDWQNTSRSMAPHKKGQLEKGIIGKVSYRDLGFKIEMGAVARGSNGYDYAKKMHNASYSLGKQSIAKGYGLSGISGKSFPVGNGYLSKPLEGNFSSYNAHLQKALDKSKV